MSLNLRVPKSLSDSGGVELNENLLVHWLKKLPNNDLLTYSQTYLESLQQFNQNKIDNRQRLLLLDIYRQPINELLFSLSDSKLSAKLVNYADRQALIDNLAALLDELAVGYKIIIDQADRLNTKLKINPIAQLAINRACEQLSFIALHAYKFYHAVPAGTFKELHQLYQLALLGKIETIVPLINNRNKAIQSLKNRYIQILLVSLSNPYGLNSGEVLETYFMMEKFAASADLEVLPEEHAATAGHFFVNCLSDRTPTPTILPQIGSKQPPTLILNTKPVLITADKVLQRPDDTSIVSGAINTALLRKLVPYLNTSYQRKQKRIPVEGNDKILLAFGIESIHQFITNLDTLTKDEIHKLSAWSVLNKNNYGYLADRKKVNNYLDIKIGDFVGIFELPTTEQKAASRLACIRWLCSDQFDISKMGMETLEGEPLAVKIKPRNQQTYHAAILLPESQKRGQMASLIVKPGLYQAKQTIEIKIGKKRFNFAVMLDKCIESTRNFERYTFIDQPV
jgi:hypothetical protein